MPGGRFAAQSGTLPPVAAGATAVPGPGATYRYPIIVDGGGNGTFAYNFEPSSISPTRNRGYVVQWFAIAAGILGYLGYRSWQPN